MWEFLNLPLPSAIVGGVLVAALVAFAAWSWHRGWRRPPPTPPAKNRKPKPAPASPEAMARAIEQIERQFGAGSVKRMTPKPKPEEPPKGS